MPLRNPSDTPTPSGASTPTGHGNVSSATEFPFPTQTEELGSGLGHGIAGPNETIGRDIPSNERICAQLPDSLCAVASGDLDAPPVPQISLPPPPKWARGPGFWRTFVAICVPLLLSALEGSVTNTALPTISDALDLGTSFSWVATALLLSSTIFQPLYGQLADIWGRKYPMIWAVVVFAAGSAICGWANDGSVLIFGRIVQGLGTGGIDLFAELILSDLVPLRQRGMYMSIKHGVFATGTTLGPLLGGVFAERNWRWCFWINLPVCGLAIILMLYWLHVGGGIKVKNVNLKQELGKIDGWGTSLLTGSIVLILVSLSTGGADYPWVHAATLVPLFIGLTGLIAFPLWENSRWCQHPIMPSSIFSNRTSAAAFVLTTIHGSLTYGVQFFLPPFFQAVKGSSPTRSGVEVLPTTLVIVVMAAIGGPLLSAWGKYRPIHQFGFALMTLGLGFHTLLESRTPIGAWFMFQFTFAAGSGIVISTMLPAVQADLPDGMNGAAAGAWAFLRGTGSLFGVAVPSAIFNMRFSQLLSTISSSEARDQLANGRAYEHATSHFVGSFGETVKLEIRDVFTQSLKSVWIVFAIWAGVGFLLTFLERQIKMRKELDTAYGLKTPKPSGANTPRFNASVVTLPATSDQRTTDRDLELM